MSTWCLKNEYVMSQKWVCDVPKLSLWCLKIEFVMSQNWVCDVSFLRISAYSKTSTCHSQIWVYLFRIYFEYVTYSILTHFVSILRNLFLQRRISVALKLLTGVFQIICASLSKYFREICESSKIILDHWNNSCIFKVL